MQAEADELQGAGHISEAGTHTEIRRAFSVEMQTEFNGLTKTVERRVFIKVYAYARTSGLIAALGARGWQTLSVLATYMDADGNCFPSQTEIADALKITRQAANERLKEIVAFRWEGNPIVTAFKVRGEGQKFSNTRYTILPVTGFLFGPGSPDQPVSTGGDMAPTRPASTGGDMGGVHAMSIADDTAAARAMSSEVDTNKIHVSGAVPPDEDKPTEVTPASGKGSEPLEAQVSTARTRARVNPARVNGQPNPDVRPMLLRHAQCYQDMVEAPYPISWGKDGAIIKRLLATYSRDELVLLQDTFFAQKADSQAALHGYTVQWLEHEAPALMARIRLQNSLTAEQREAIAALVAEGVTEPTATALASEYRVEDIRRQLHAHVVRKDRLRSPAAALVKAIREGWQVPEESEPDYYRPLRLAAASDGTPVGPPPEEIRVQLERTIAHLVGR